jgi:hypothetical protein
VLFQPPQNWLAQRLYMEKTLKNETAKKKQTKTESETESETINKK